MMEHQPLTPQELEQVNELTMNNKVKTTGNIIYTQKVGNAKVVFFDDEIDLSAEGKRKYITGVERSIEAIYPGYKCTITAPLLTWAEIARAERARVNE